MAILSEKEILKITSDKFAECGRSNPEECDRVVGGIIESLRSQGNLELAVEVAGNLATRHIRNEMIAELEHELGNPANEVISEVA